MTKIKVFLIIKTKMNNNNKKEMYKNKRIFSNTLCRSESRLCVAHSPFDVHSQACITVWFTRHAVVTRCLYCVVIV